MKRRNFLKSVGSTVAGLAALPIAIKALGVMPESNIAGEAVEGSLWYAPAGLDRGGMYVYLDNEWHDIGEADVRSNYKMVP